MTIKTYLVKSRGALYSTMQFWRKMFTSNYCGCGKKDISFQYTNVDCEKRYCSNVSQSLYLKSRLLILGGDTPNLEFPFTTPKSTWSKWILKTLLLILWFQDGSDLHFCPTYMQVGVLVHLARQTLPSVGSQTFGKLTQMNNKVADEFNFSFYQCMIFYFLL